MKSLLRKLSGGIVVAGVARRAAAAGDAFFYTAFILLCIFFNFVNAFIVNKASSHLWHYVCLFK